MLSAAQLAFLTRAVTDLLSRQVGARGRAWRQILILHSRVLIADRQTCSWGDRAEDREGGSDPDGVHTVSDRTVQ